MRMSLITNEVDENDYHYAGRGLITTLAVRSIGRGLITTLAVWSMWRTGRAGEVDMWVGGSISAPAKYTAPPPSPLKAPRRRAGYQVSLPPQLSEISSNPVTTGVCGRSELIA